VPDLCCTLYVNLSSPPDEGDDASCTSKVEVGRDGARDDVQLIIYFACIYSMLVMMMSSTVNCSTVYYTGFQENELSLLMSSACPCAYLPDLQQCCSPAHFIVS
jgi:hypothetical protein